MVFIEGVKYACEVSTFFFSQESNLQNPLESPLCTNT